MDANLSVNHSSVSGTYMPDECNHVCRLHMLRMLLFLNQIVPQWNFYILPARYLQEVFYFQEDFYFITAFLFLLLSSSVFRRLGNWHKEKIFTLWQVFALSRLDSFWQECV